MLFKRFGFLLLAAGLAAAAAAVAVTGCSPAAQPTLMATVVINTQAAPASQPPAAETVPADYPGPGQAVTAPAQESTAYPVDAGPASAPTATAEGYPGPAGVPAVDNRAKVTGTLIEKAADTENAAFTRLRVSVQAVEDVDGMPNFAKDLLNTEADLYIDTALLPELNPNDRFEAQVLYTGDEGGGRYNVLEIKKVE